MPVPFRLLCALLTLLLALPAMQANACAPASGGHAAHAAAPAHDGHGAHAASSHDPAPDPTPAMPSPSEPRHECVGCIPPIDVGVYRPVARLSFAVDRTEGPAQAGLPAGRRAPPEPPPPRSTV